jgi:Restriction endonuclease NotI
MRVAEVFGYDIADNSQEAWTARRNKYCRFRDSTCTKSSITDPLGICTLADGGNAASLCPVRFLEGHKIFADAAKIAFGSGSEFAIFPEVRILEVPAQIEGGRNKKIGKVDFLIGKIEGGRVIDFAAIEIQAAYFSGGSLRVVFQHYIASRSLEGIDSKRRPDFRSCAQKRLVPQLQLKIPVFRRWGKKVFVVVDTEFFASLPKFPQTTPSNSELTWLTYAISMHDGRFGLSEPLVIFSEWDEVQNSLREGKPPEPSEILNELQAKFDGPVTKRPVVLRC